MLHIFKKYFTSLQIEQVFCFLPTTPMVLLQLTEEKYIVKGNFKNRKVVRNNNKTNWNLSLSMSNTLSSFLFLFIPVMHVSVLFPILGIAVTSSYLPFNEQGPAPVLSIMELWNHRFQRNLKTT